MRVGVTVGVGVGVTVTVGVAVFVAVGVASGVTVTVGVAVSVGVAVNVGVGLLVNVGAGLAVNVGVAVTVGVGVDADCSNEYVHVSPLNDDPNASKSRKRRTHPPTTAVMPAAFQVQFRCPAVMVQSVVEFVPAVKTSLHCCVLVGAAVEVSMLTVTVRPADTAFVKYSAPDVKLAANSESACVPALPAVA